MRILFVVLAFCFQSFAMNVDDIKPQADKIQKTTSTSISNDVQNNVSSENIVDEKAEFAPRPSQLDNIEDDFSPDTDVHEKSPSKNHIGKDVRYAQHYSLKESDLIMDRYDQKKSEGFDDDSNDHAVLPKKLFSKDEKLNLGQVGKRKISINLTEDVSVKDAIIEISRLSGVDIELDPRVDGSIILVLKNKPVEEVLDRVAKLANLRKSIDGGVVRLEADIPFMMSYNLNFLDMSRNTSVNTFTSSGIGVSSGQNMGNGQMGTNNNMNNGMNNNNMQNRGQAGGNSMSVQNHSSMWESFETGLKQIISKRDDTEYAINKQAGIVTIMAPLTVHKVISEYIEKVKKNSTAQILIEVRVVEVALKDEFRTGINFNTNDGIFSAALASVSGIGASTVSDPTLGAPTKSSLTAAIQFLQTFGTTRTLSSPRLNVMNNQPAVISFATDQVYFQITPTLQNQYAAVGATGGTIANPTTPIVVTSTSKTIPVGVILTLQAIADTDTQEITMNVHPSITNISSYVADPSASFLTQYIQNTTSSGSSKANTTAITNNIPVVAKKELDSVLRIKSGQIMVIGGFNSEQTGVQESGIPFLKDIPLLGRLFSQKTNYINNVETVIFIKASIMETSNPILKNDVEFGKRFS